MSLMVSDSARSFSLATSLSALEKERVEASVLRSSSSYLDFNEGNKELAALRRSKCADRNFASLEFEFLRIEQYEESDWLCLC